MLGAFYCGNAGGDCGLAGSLSPARQPLRLRLRARYVHGSPERAQQGFKALPAARSGMLRVGNKVSSFYGTQADQRGVGQLGDVGGDAPSLVKNSAGTLLIPVPISPPKMDGIEPFVRWGAARLGGSCHAWVMRALIARWLAVIAMLGLLALVIATSRAPCVPYGLWHTLQMNCR